MPICYRQPCRQDNVPLPPTFFPVNRGFRQKGNEYSKYLFYKLTEINKQLAVINIDKKSKQTLNFLKSFGFKEFISQHEMKKKLV